MQNLRERKLVNFTCPMLHDRGGKYNISFAYYESGKWTGESEEVSLTEQELYELVKPLLITNPLVYRRGR